VTLSPDEARRYARHLVLKDIGGAGQQKLKAARVLVIGAGGLGSPAIAYLAAAGVGTLGVVDDDRISLSNLQRQIVHRTDAVGQPKVEGAQAFARGINPETSVLALEARLDDGNAKALLRGYDLVLDGSDNFDTRRAVAAAAAKLALPLVAGAVSMWDGQVTVFLPGGSGFSDLYPAAPAPEDVPSCEAVGVLGPVTGVIGTLMAVEAIKLITGAGTSLSGRLLLYDGRAARFTEVAF
jgi:molybdopterin/thiamine biosynthesis adenylyltransferase